MKRFRNILAYVDDRPESLGALKTAVGLAHLFGAHVNVMDVVEPRISGELAETAVGARVAELEELVSPYRGELQITITVARGKVSLELIRQAIRQRNDLVIKTARGTERGRRVFFGTTAMHLIRKCPCPVWLVSPTPLRERPRIVAAVDPQSEGGGTKLAVRILDHARALTRHLGGELHVVHAWYPAAAGLLRSRVSADELHTYITDVEHSARSALEDVLAIAPRSDVPEVHHLLRGEPQEVIPEFAAREGVDAIVMGSLGRGGIAGLLIGEMAEEILSRVQCGVFCVKPDGFVTPVSAGDGPAASERAKEVASL
jgi:nucleotide-binding universal stress UspA family protein